MVKGSLGWLRGVWGGNGSRVAVVAGVVAARVAGVVVAAMVINFYYLSRAYSRFAVSILQ